MSAAVSFETDCYVWSGACYVWAIGHHGTTLPSAGSGTLYGDFGYDYCQWPSGEIPPELWGCETKAGPVLLPRGECAWAVASTYAVGYGSESGPAQYCNIYQI